MSSSSFSLDKTLFWKILLWIIRIVMVSCSTAVTLVIVYSCVLRYFFGGNFYGSEDVILLFAFWLYFIGAAHGSFENSHIKADLISVYVRDLRKKDFLGLLALFLTIVVNFILLYWAWNYFLWGLDKMALSTALKIPLVITQSAIFFGLLLMGFYHIYYFQRNLRLYIRKGYFTTPQDGDFLSQKAIEKYGASAVPTKEEANRLLAASKEQAEADLTEEAPSEDLDAEEPSTEKEPEEGGNA